MFYLQQLEVLIATALLGCGVFFIILTTAANAEVQAQLFLSEVAPAPPTAEAEWVELYNASSITITLDGWYLEDRQSQPHVIAQLSGELAAGSAMVVELSGTFLNNTGDTVVLYDAEDRLVDSLTYSGTELNTSWHRDAATTTLFIAAPSPGILTINPTTAAPTHEVLLSAVQPCPPAGEAEWVELYHASDYPVSLENWSLRDAADNVQTLTGTLLAGEKTRFYLDKSLLNNTGDTVRIFDQTQNLVIETSYTVCDSMLALLFSDGTLSLPKTETSPLSSPLPETTPPVATNTGQLVESSTVLSSTSSTHSTNPSQSSLPFDPTKLRLTSHPDFWENGFQPIVFHHKQLPRWPTVSAILGSVCVSWGGVRLKQLHHTLYTHETATPNSPP